MPTAGTWRSSRSRTAWTTAAPTTSSAISSYEISTPERRRASLPTRPAGSRTARVRRPRSVPTAGSSRSSLASDLVFDDLNKQRDVFVRDVQLGTTTRISVDTAGSDSNGASFTPAISPSGRYVAFTSAASDLVLGDTATVNVFVRDRQNSTTARVTVDTGNGDPDSASYSPSISANGRYVAFLSDATDLVAGDGNGIRDVFVRDRQSGTTTRVSVNTTGGDPGGTNVSTDLAPRSAVMDGSSRSAPMPRTSCPTTTTTCSMYSSVTGRTTRRSACTPIHWAAKPTQPPSRSAGVAQRERQVRRVRLARNQSRPARGADTLFRHLRAVRRHADDHLGQPTSVARGSIESLELLGTGFFTGVQVSASLLGPGGVTVDGDPFVLSETRMFVSVTVADDAPPGPRHVTVWNPGFAPRPLESGFGLCANSADGHLRDAAYRFDRARASTNRKRRPYRTSPHRQSRKAPFSACAPNGRPHMPPSRAESTQNSLPSGSASTTHVRRRPGRRPHGVAPNARTRSTSASWSSGTRSMCRRFLIGLRLRHRHEHQAGIGVLVLGDHDFVRRPRRRSSSRAPPPRSARARQGRSRR